jgi:hypothetical protein
MDTFALWAGHPALRDLPWILETREMTVEKTARTCGASVL